ncbi:MAG TPA: hypothetical protein VLN59_05440 [Burkholderiales bacterium]|nr:hypothetical protein [Burkholderiales bacterium]
MAAKKKRSGKKKTARKKKKRRKLPSTFTTKGIPWPKPLVIILK